LPALDGYDALIASWTGQQPPDELDAYELAAAKAVWLEERYFSNWAELLKKLLGAK
jgi:hypothetical protein